MKCCTKRCPTYLIYLSGVVESKFMTPVARNLMLGLEMDTGWVSMLKAMATGCIGSTQRQLGSREVLYSPNETSRTCRMVAICRKTIRNVGNRSHKAKRHQNDLHSKPSSQQNQKRHITHLELTIWVQPLKLHLHFVIPLDNASNRTTCDI